VKKHYATKLWLIGIINALAFMFIPPLFHFLGATEVLMMGSLIVCNIIGYINFIFIKRVFNSDLQKMKFRHVMFPFAGWLATVVLLSVTQIYYEYIYVTVGIGGFLRTYAPLAYYILLILNGLTILISSTA